MLIRLNPAADCGYIEYYILHCIWKAARRHLTLGTFFARDDKMIGTAFTICVFSWVNGLDEVDEFGNMIVGTVIYICGYSMPHRVPWTPALQSWLETWKIVLGPAGFTPCLSGRPYRRFCPGLAQVYKQDNYFLVLYRSAWLRPGIQEHPMLLHVDMDPTTWQVSTCNSAHPSAGSAHALCIIRYGPYGPVHLDLRAMRGLHNSCMAAAQLRCIWPPRGWRIPVSARMEHSFSDIHWGFV